MGSLFAGRAGMNGGLQPGEDDSPLVSWVRGVPPVTRYLTGTILLLAVSGLLSHGLRGWLALNWLGGVALWQPWRLATNFAYLNVPGPFMFLNMLVALFLVSRWLETANFCSDVRAYTWFLFSNAVILLVLSLIQALVGGALGRSDAWGGALAFVLFQFCAQADPSHRMRFLFRIPAVYGPPIGVFLLSLLRGSVDVAALAGLLVGHLQHMVTQSDSPVPARVKELLETPVWWFGGGLSGPIPSAASLNAAAPGPSTSSRGYAWGRGQKLGEGPLPADEEQGAVRPESTPTVYGTMASSSDVTEPAGRELGNEPPSKP